MTILQILFFERVFPHTFPTFSTALTKFSTVYLYFSTGWNERIHHWATQKRSILKTENLMDTELICSSVKKIAL